MVLDNIKRLHAHFKWLASGEFTERDFDFVIPGKNKEDSPGRMAMGDINAARKKLIMSDAKRHLEDLEEKFPELKEEMTVDPKKVSKKPSKKAEEVIEEEEE